MVDFTTGKQEINKNINEKCLNLTERYSPSYIKENFTTKTHEKLYICVHKENVLKQCHMLYCVFNSANGNLIYFVSLTTCKSV